MRISRVTLSKQTVKLFEIGLGCDKGTHYGAGVLVWKRILRADDQLWTADIDGKCIENGIKSGALTDVNVLQGNQDNPETLKSWVVKSKGDFDMIIDDGSHVTRHIVRSLQAFWDTLLPGGYYFIEDLQVNGFRETIVTTNGTRATVIEVIQDWILQLLINGRFSTRPLLPLPSRLKWILCQAEACVLAKCDTNDAARCTA